MALVVSQLNQFTKMGCLRKDLEFQRVLDEILAIIDEKKHAVYLRILQINYQKKHLKILKKKNEREQILIEICLLLQDYKKQNVELKEMIISAKDHINLTINHFNQRSSLF